MKVKSPQLMKDQDRRIYGSNAVTYIANNTRTLNGRIKCKMKIERNINPTDEFNKRINIWTAIRIILGTNDLSITLAYK